MCVYCSCEKLQYSRLSHHVSFIKIAGITALCMSLNFIKYSSHLKENKKNILFAYKVHQRMFVLHVGCVTFY